MTLHQPDPEIKTGKDLRVLSLPELKNQLMLRVKKRSLERDYPNWGLSREAKILEGLIERIEQKDAGIKQRIEDAEFVNQLLCSLDAFDEWQRDIKTPNNEERILIGTDPADAKKQAGIVKEALISEVDRLLEKYQLQITHIGKSKNQIDYVIISRRSGNTMSDDAARAIIRHIMRLQKIAVEFENGRTTIQFKREFSPIINSLFSAGFANEDDMKAIHAIGKMLPQRGKASDDEKLVKSHSANKPAHSSSAEIEFKIKNEQDKLLRLKRQYETIFSQEEDMLLPEIIKLREEIQARWKKIYSDDNLPQNEKIQILSDDLKKYSDMKAKITSEQYQLLRLKRQYERIFSQDIKLLKPEIINFREELYKKWLDVYPNISMPNNEKIQNLTTHLEQYVERVKEFQSFFDVDTELVKLISFQYGTDFLSEEELQSIRKLQQNLEKEWMQCKNDSSLSDVEKIDKLGKLIQHSKKPFELIKKKQSVYKSYEECFSKNDPNLLSKEERLILEMVEDNLKREWKQCVEDGKTFDSDKIQELRDIIYHFYQTFYNHIPSANSDDKVEVDRILRKEMQEVAKRYHLTYVLEDGKITEVKKNDGKPLGRSAKIIEKRLHDINNLIQRIQANPGITQKRLLADLNELKGKMKTTGKAMGFFGVNVVTSKTAIESAIKVVSNGLQEIQQSRRRMSSSG